MPERCRVCTHPKRDEINALIIEGKISLREISRRYEDISYSGLRWHKKHHLNEIIAQVQTERKEITKGQVTSTIDALDAIVNKLPEVLETATLNSIIRALELRAKLTGEEKQPPRIIIEWGIAVEPEYRKQVDNVRYRVIDDKSTGEVSTEVKVDLKPRYQTEEPQDE